MEPAATTPLRWPFWRRLLFRCSFGFFILVAAPWDWLRDVPGFGWISDLYNAGNDWVVNGVNSRLLHVRDELVPVNGSGDTSFGWAMLWTYCSLAVAAGLLWSAIDRRRTSYVQLNYWLCVLLRYYLALVALGYGIAKLFLTQMPFPGPSELATPLGDFLPMRLSWMFVGYSAPYQFFSGLVECLAGLLLLWRRTATLGAMLAAGVFLNVAALNLSYDIPVKIFSIEMLLISLFLLANESRRLACFFLLNRPAPGCSVYHYQLRKRWQRIGRVVLKVAFIGLAIGMTTAQTAELHAYYNSESFEAVAPGLYAVTEFRLNGTAVTDSLRWTDVALDGKRSGSFRGGDPLATTQYGRKYFIYDVDSGERAFTLRRVSDDSLFADLRYQWLDSSKLVLRGIYRSDSLEMTLSKSPHRFQLAERQFHWISEGNR